MFTESLRSGNPVVCITNFPYDHEWVQAIISRWKFILISDFYCAVLRRLVLAGDP